MFDPTQLLNSMLSSGTRGSPLTQILGSLAGGGGGGGGRYAGTNPVGGLLGSLLGGGGSPGGGLGSLLGGGLGGGLGGSAPGMGGGSLLGQLAQAMLGGGMRGGAGGLGGSLTRMGGMAVLGSLAASLLKQMSQKHDERVPSPQEAAEHAINADPNDAAETALLMIRGMIAAAKADGEIDAEEQRNIVGKLGDAANNSEVRAFLEREMAAPLDIDGLVASVKDKMTGAKLFAASALAINADAPAEQIYLRTLAQRLGLEVPTVSA
jgi:uncharacterized membrane protein YebE (DUF533 family)